MKVIISIVVRNDDIHITINVRIRAGYEKLAGILACAFHQHRIISIRRCRHLCLLGCTGQSVAYLNLRSRQSSNLTIDKCELDADLTIERNDESRTVSQNELHFSRADRHRTEHCISILTWFSVCTRSSVNAILSYSLTKPGPGLSVVI